MGSEDTRNRSRIRGGPRAAAGVVLGKVALQDKADRAAGEDGGSDGERENFRISSLSPQEKGHQNTFGGPLRELDENEPRKSPGS